LWSLARIANRKTYLERETKPPAIKSRPSLRGQRSCSARLARPAPHAMLDPTDRALVHPISPSKVLSPLSSHQGSPDFTNLFVRQLGERVLFPSYTSPVPQAVGRVAGVITDIKVLRPVVSPVIVAVAHKLVGAEQPTQDHAHHGAMQHDLTLTCSSL